MKKEKLQMKKVVYTLMLVGLHVNELIVIAQQGTYRDNATYGADMLLMKLITDITEQVGDEYVSLGINVSGVITDFMIDWTKEHDRLG